MIRIRARCYVRQAVAGVAAVQAGAQIQYQVVSAQFIPNLQDRFRLRNWAEGAIAVDTFAVHLSRGDLDTAQGIDSETWTVGWLPVDAAEGADALVVTGEYARAPDDAAEGGDSLAAGLTAPWIDAAEGSDSLAAGFGYTPTDAAEASDTVTTTGDYRRIHRDGARATDRVSLIRVFGDSALINGAAINEAPINGRQRLISSTGADLEAWKEGGEAEDSVSLTGEFRREHDDAADAADSAEWTADLRRSPTDPAQAVDTAEFSATRRHEHADPSTAADGALFTWARPQGGLIGAHMLNEGPINSHQPVRR